MSQTCLLQLVSGPDPEGRYTYRLVRPGPVPVT